MNRLAAGIIAMFCVAGCTHFKDPYPQLRETQPQLVAGCALLGTVAETADADRISATLAQRAMVDKVKERSVALGATHIVWLHQTRNSAAAQAYQCAEPEAGAPEPQKAEPIDSAGESPTR
jgi:hypothetical protein